MDIKVFHYRFKKANPAVHLYQQLGFQIIKENEEEYLMKYTERRE